MTDRVLEWALDGVSARQRVTANNIANADTPGFKRQHISFEASLRDALGRSPRMELVGKVTHPGHIPIPSGRRSSGPDVSTPHTVSDSVMRNDGNNVDIEAEMAQLIKDQVHYNVLAQEVSKRYSMLRDAINEGRR